MHVQHADRHGRHVAHHGSVVLRATERCAIYVSDAMSQLLNKVETLTRQQWERRRQHCATRGSKERTSGPLYPSSLLSTAFLARPTKPRGTSLTYEFILFSVHLKTCVLAAVHRTRCSGFKQFYGWQNVFPFWKKICGGQIHDVYRNSKLRLAKCLPAADLIP